MLVSGHANGGKTIHSKIVYTSTGLLYTFVVIYYVYNKNVVLRPKKNIHLRKYICFDVLMTIRDKIHHGLLQPVSAYLFSNQRFISHKEIEPANVDGVFIHLKICVFFFFFWLHPLKSREILRKIINTTSSPLYLYKGVRLSGWVLCQ